MPAELTETLRWSPHEVERYGVAVGEGASAPRVLPSFAFTLLFDNAATLLGNANQTQVLHAEQSLHVCHPLSRQGIAAVTQRVTGMAQRGPNVFVHLQASAADATSGARLASARWSMVVRGASIADLDVEVAEGDAAVDGGPAPEPVPDRPADRELPTATRPDQALLYRLCGDRNPMHADPAFAARGGFDAPILHGLCTLGISARRLGGEHLALGCRFSAPVYPGEVLRVRVWDEPHGVRFQTLGQDGRVVVDRGVAR